jgi:hypothetical protein
MTRAEEDLRQAVVVSVITDKPSVPTDEIAALIAPWLEMEATSLVLRQVVPLVFLLVLCLMEMVAPLVDRRPLLRAATFSIACKRWSRFAGSMAGIMPTLVEFELQGIPNHVWETSTAAELLSPFAWIRQVQPDTVRLLYLTAFRCTAWARDHTSIPASRELWIVEPPSVVEEPLGKRALVYTIDIKFSVLGSPSEAVPPPMDDDNDDSGDPPGGASGAARALAPTPFLQKAGVGPPRNRQPVAANSAGDWLSA